MKRSVSRSSVVWVLGGASLSDYGQLFESLARGRVNLQRGGTRLDEKADHRRVQAAGAKVCL